MTADVNDMARPRSVRHDMQTKNTASFLNKFVVRVANVQLDPLPLAHLLHEVVQGPHGGVRPKQAVGDLLVELG